MLEVARLIEDAVSHLIVEVANFFGNAYADTDVCSTYGQSTRRQVGRITMLCRNPQNQLPSLFVDFLPAMQRAIDSADRNIRQFGEFPNSNPLHKRMVLIQTKRTYRISTRLCPRHDVFL